MGTTNEVNSISEIVLMAREYDGWLSVVEEFFGKEIADACEIYDDALMEGEALAEEYYYETERQQVAEKMREWIKEKEFVEFASECADRRKAELEKLISKAKQKLAEKMEHRGDTEMKKRMLQDIKKMENIARSDITPDKIQQAKNYPIDQIIRVERGMAKCINHEEKNPSMNCKNNFVYCHSCGYHADAIGVYMKVKGCGFIEAVNTLSL